MQRGVKLLRWPVKSDAAAGIVFVIAAMVTARHMARIGRSSGADLERILDRVRFATVAE